MHSLPDTDRKKPLTQSTSYRVVCTQANICRPVLQLIVGDGGKGGCSCILLPSPLPPPWLSLLSNSSVTVPPNSFFPFPPFLFDKLTNGDQIIGWLIYIEGNVFSSRHSASSLQHLLFLSLNLPFRTNWLLWLAKTSYIGKCVSTCVYENLSFSQNWIWLHIHLLVPKRRMGADSSFDTQTRRLIPGRSFVYCYFFLGGPRRRNSRARGGGEREVTREVTSPRDRRSQLAGRKKLRGIHHAVYREDRDGSRDYLPTGRHRRGLYGFCLLL